MQRAPSSPTLAPRLWPLLPLAPRSGGRARRGGGKAAGELEGEMHRERNRRMRSFVPRRAVLRLVRRSPNAPLLFLLRRPQLLPRVTSTAAVAIQLDLELRLPFLAAPAMDSKEARKRAGTEAGGGVEMPKRKGPAPARLAIQSPLLALPEEEEPATAGGRRELSSRRSPSI
ncbi:unnamed protein product [Urochloa humidicola]